MWIALALLTAVCTALRDVASKHATRTVDPVLIALGVAGVPAIVLGGIVLASGPAAPAQGYWTALLVSGGINALATPLIVVALQRSDLSLVSPLMSLTPLFMLATGTFVLGELPAPTGMAGVAVIVLGAYLLSTSRRGADPLLPFRALLRDPGARLMLLVAFLYSVSATYDKVGTTASSPFFWAASTQAVTALGIAPVALWRLRRKGERRPTHKVAGPPGEAPRLAGLGGATAILLAGALTTVAAAAQMTALTLTLAAFVIAVKRTSTLFSVLLGRSVFREEAAGRRLVAAAVMLAGFILVTLG